MSSAEIPVAHRSVERELNTQPARTKGNQRPPEETKGKEGVNLRTRPSLNAGIMLEARCGEESKAEADREREVDAGVEREEERRK